MKHLGMIKTVLGMVTGFVALALLFVVFVYPEIPTAIYAFSGLLVVCLAALAWLNQKALKVAVKARNVRYGTNALVTVALMLTILAVLNFLNFNHFYRKDFTKNQVHSLSEQTTKILADLKKEVKLTVFNKTQSKDENKGVLDNFIYASKGRLKIETVDPDRDPARAKAMNVKKYGTIIIETEGLGTDKKETRVEEITEEKITNGLIKILKEKNITICFLTGHGEKNTDGADSEGLSQTKNDITSQTYEVKTMNLLEEGKVNDACTALLVIGSNKAFFPKEIEILKNYLRAGGRALFALDPNVKGGTDFHPELTSLLSEWFIVVEHNLVLDPTSKLLGVNAGVPVIAQYNRDHPISKDFQAVTLFPMSSVVDIKPNQPAGLKAHWIAKSTPRAFAMKDFRQIVTGAIRIDPNKDKAGAFTVMVAVEGSINSPDPAKIKPARIVAMGSSGVMANAYARHGANMDLFMNAVSWLVNDENLIAIRPKEEGSTAVAMTQAQGRIIQLLTMLLVPGAVLLFGLFVWIRRKKL